MTLRQRLVDAEFEAEHIPGGYQLLGDILLTKFPKKKTKISEKKAVAKKLIEVLPNTRAVCEIERVSGELRRPKVTMLFSKDGKDSMETVHTEHGIKFKLDVGKVMFSKGNLAERVRLVSKIKPSETIVDMFAGIGYFSLGIAKHSKDANMISIEKNPTAFKYLKQNMELNGIRNIMPIRDDCRKVKLEEKADRVLMGYFPGTEQFLPAAFGFLKPHGTIHYHNIYSEDELVEKPLSELKSAAALAGFRVVNAEHHVVKSYAPRVWHVVVDAEVEML